MELFHTNFFVSGIWGLHHVWDVFDPRRRSIEKKNLRHTLINVILLELFYLSALLDCVNRSSSLLIIITISLIFSKSKNRFSKQNLVSKRQFFFWELRRALPEGHADKLLADAIRMISSEMIEFSLVLKGFGRLAPKSLQNHWFSISFSMILSEIIAWIKTRYFSIVFSIIASEIIDFAEFFYDLGGRPRKLYKTIDFPLVFQWFRLKSLPGINNHLFSIGCSVTSSEIIVL